MKRLKHYLIKVLPLCLVVASIFMLTASSCSNAVSTLGPGASGTSASIIAASRTQPQTQFVATYKGEGGSYPYALAADNQGNVYIAGYTGYTNSNGSRDFSLIKYDKNGKELWTAIYKSPGAGGGGARSLALDSSGNIYVTGRIMSNSTGYDYLTVKYDDSGKQVWAVQYDGAGHGDDGAVALKIDSTGVYVTGSGTGAQGNEDFLTIKYDFAGKQIWEASYNSRDNGDDFAQALAIDSSGNMYVTGTANGVQGAEGGSTYLPAAINPNGKGYFLTVKYDSSGRQVWSAANKGTAPGYDDIPHAIAVDKSGSVYVAGESADSVSGYNYLTIKYSTAGSEVWADRYQGGSKGNGGAFDMDIDVSGNILVTGYISGVVNNIGTWEYGTVKYSSDGKRLWDARYSGPKGTNIAYSIKTDKEENVYVTGVSGFVKYDSTSMENFATLKYDKNGVQQWTARYGDGDGTNNVGKLLALDNAGNVYVSGYSIPNQPGSYAVMTTIKYAQ